MSLQDFLKKKNEKIEKALKTKTEEIKHNCTHLLEALREEGHEKYEELFNQFKFRYDKLNVQRQKIEKFYETLVAELENLGKNPMDVIMEMEKKAEAALLDSGAGQVYTAIKKSTKRVVSEAMKVKKEVKKEVEKAKKEVEKVKTAAKKAVKEVEKKVAKKTAKKVEKKSAKKVEKKTVKKVAAKKEAKKWTKKTAKKAAPKTAKKVTKAKAAPAAKKKVTKKKTTKK